MPSFPLAINGKYYDFSSVELNIRGRLYVGVTAINYSDSNERGEARGAARQVLGRTPGEYKAEGDIELLRPHFDELVTDLGDAFYDEEFSIVASYAAAKMPTVTDRLIRCMFKSRGSDNSPGNDALKVKLGLDVDGIIFNGRLPYANFRR